MKLKVLFMLFVLLLTACGQNEDLRIPEQTKPERIRGRSVDEAIEIACSVKDAVSADSRNNNTVKVKILTNNASRSEVLDTLIYIVEFEDNGFVMVSKPMTVKPILGIIEEGAFDDFSTVTNPGFQNLITNAKSYVESASSGFSPIVDIRPFYYNDTIYFFNQIKPRVTVKWNQGWPENIYTPNKLAGCGPVAMGMVLSFFEKPKQMALTFSGADKSNITLNWASLKKHTTSNLGKNPSNSEMTTHYNGCANDESHKDLGRFMRQLGELSNSDYSSPSATSTYFDNATTVLRNLLPEKVFYKSKFVSDFNSLFDLLSETGVAFVYGSRGPAAHFFCI